MSAVRRARRAGAGAPTGPDVRARVAARAGARSVLGLPAPPGVANLRGMPACTALAFLLALTQDSGPKFDPAVTRADLAACVGVLASDELRGRGNGTEDCAKAGEYLASRLALAGIEPAGDDGTYFQHVPLFVMRHKVVPRLTLWHADGSTSEALAGIDFDWRGGVPSKERLKVRLVGKPEDAPREADPKAALFVDGSTLERRRWLGDAGGQGFGLVITRGSAEPGKAALTAMPEGRPEVGPKSDAPPTASLSLRGPLIERLRSGDVKELRVEADVVRDDLPAFNVVGRIAGVGTPGEPTLKDEAVMFSAHYDHMGISERGSGEDHVMNGADDDASGCAAVLELAEALVAGPAPARTLLFFFATGEEIGLKGTYWFVEHPVVPLERLVCDLNLEMIGRPDELAGGAGKLWLTGFERSNPGPGLAGMGLPVVADPRPAQRFFERSDNYALALRGVVAQTLSTYNLHADYHRVTDELDTLDLAHMEGCVRAALSAARGLADGTLDPK